MAELHVLLESDLCGYDFRYLPVQAQPSAPAFALHVVRALQRDRYELVHSHGFTAGFCTALPAKMVRTPHLMTSHDVLNASQFAGPGGRVKRLVAGQLLALTDCIHSVSQDAQENLFSYFPKLARCSSRTVVIDNGIEVERFLEEDVRDLRTEFGLGEEHCLIGFLGRFMSQKGFRYLVEAMDLLVQEADLPRKPVVLTFDDGGYVREEKRAVRERGLDECFRFLPFTPNVASTIRGLDMVVMPSLWEACGLLAMETMVCGTPFIGAECIGLREVMRDTPAIRIPPADAVALKLALSREIRADSKAGFAAFRQSAAERFSVARTSSALQHLYGTLLR